MQTVSNQAKMLGSWKEIASYLGKGIRTVQRWERQFGLPVRRPKATTRGVVCALPEELDEWFTLNWGPRNTLSNGSGNGSQDSSDNGAANGSGNGAQGGDGFHASIQIAYQLRDKNRQLIADLMQTAHDVAEGCGALAGRSRNHSKPGNGT